jgi:flagellar basal body rod protein FlgG
LSRGGALNVDRNGELAVPGGATVQGAGGAIEIPATALDVRVDAAGRVLADGKTVGSLQVVQLAQGVAATSLGGGLFQAAEAAELKPVETPVLHAGYTEASNVVASQEMVQMMETTRHAEAMVKLLQGADELLGQTIRKLGELS